jgi:hypothetical protein
VDDRGIAFDSLQWKENFIFSTESRPVIGFSQSPIQRELRGVSGGVNRPTHLHLQPRIRIRGIISPLSSTYSWHGA